MSDSGENYEPFYTCFLNILKLCLMTNMNVKEFKLKFHYIKFWVWF